MALNRPSFSTPLKLPCAFNALLRATQSAVMLAMVPPAGKIHEHARIYRVRSVAGSQILNFMS